MLTVARPIYHHDPQLQRPDSRRHGCRGRIRQGVCILSTTMNLSAELENSSYSLLFASRGANVVVNDFNASAAQKVVDQITKGVFFFNLGSFTT